jgi:hypothetical protein
MNRIDLVGREEEIKEYARKVYFEIRGTHSKTKGMAIYIGKVGAKNGINFLIGEEPAKTELIGRLEIPFPKYKPREKWEIIVRGFHREDEAMCIAILVLAEALLIPVNNILEGYEASEDSEHKIPESLTNQKKHLGKILHQKIKEWHGKKMGEKFSQLEEKYPDKKNI